MKKSPFVITISGDPVAGKSSAIDALTEKYEAEGFTLGDNEDGKCIVRIATGKMYRLLADEASIERDGLTRFEFLNKYAKQPGNTMRGLKEFSPNPDFLAHLSDKDLDKSVDAYIDDYTLLHAEMVKAKYEGKDDVIIILDSRIAGLLMKRMGRENMTIRFAIQPEIAAERLVKRAISSNSRSEIDIEGLSADEAFLVAFNSQRQRTANERERFIKQYSNDIFDQDENAKVDLQNLDNYDLVINTSGTTIEREVEVLYSCIEKARSGQEYDKFWRSTKYIYPGSVTKEDIDTNKSPRISAIKVGSQYYALHGQEYVGIANHNGYMIEQRTGEENGYPLVPVDLAAKKRQFIFAPDKEGNIKGVPADLYVQRNITKNLVENFERDYGFKYPERGVAKLPTVEEVRNADKKDSRRGSSGPDSH